MSITASHGCADCGVGAGDNGSAGRGRTRLRSRQGQGKRLGQGAEISPCSSQAAVACAPFERRAIPHLAFDRQHLTMLSDCWMTAAFRSLELSYQSALLKCFFRQHYIQSAINLRYLSVYNQMIYLAWHRTVFFNHSRAKILHEHGQRVIFADGYGVSMVLGVMRTRSANVRHRSFFLPLVCCLPHHIGRGTRSICQVRWHTAGFVRDLQELGRDVCGAGVGCVMALGRRRHRDSLAKLAGGDVLRHNGWELDRCRYSSSKA